MLTFKNLNPKPYRKSLFEKERHSQRDPFGTSVQHGRKIFNYPLIVLVICFLYFVFSSEVSAQQTTELTVSPPVSYIQIKPGSKSRHTITLENSGNQTITVAPSIVDFKPDQETGVPVLAQTNSFPYLDEQSKSLQMLTLEPKQKAQLVLQFTVPQFAPDKEFPLTVLFSSQNSAQTTLDSAASVQTTIGSNVIILVSAKSELEQLLTISDFNIPKVVDSFSEITVQPVAKNDRFSSSIASGSATLKNMLGQTVAEYDIYPDVILGMNERPLRFVPKGALPNLEISPQTFRYNPFLLLGIYTLTIEFTPTTTIPYTASFSYSFFGLPIFVFCIAGLILSLYLGYLYKNKKSFFTNR